MGVVSAAYSASASGISVGLIIVIWIIFYVVVALGMYGSFQKAGQPGWAAFVPIYNFIIMLKVAGRPATWGWFLLLALVPFVGGIGLLVVYIIVLNDISASFGHGGGFTVGLVLLGPVFWYILWLGASQYQGPAALARASGYPGQYPQPGYPQQGGYPGQQARLPATGRLPAAEPVSRPGPSAGSDASPAIGDSPNAGTARSGSSARRRIPDAVLRQAAVMRALRRSQAVITKDSSAR